MPTLESEQDVDKYPEFIERGKVNGINHLVDLNIFNGDNTQFKQLIGGSQPIDPSK
jgi:GH25 family lysozyme M1 (1,4-beta-N-acetylmuramidase)